MSSHLRTPLLLLAVVLALAVAGCAGGGDDTADASDTMPDWIVSVEPAPGATLAVPDLVRVTVEPPGADRIVRLVLDGTDVTSSSTLAGGVLSYDPNEGPVALGAGDHTAAVELAERPTADATDFAVVDRFTWEFRTG